MQSKTKPEGLPPKNVERYPGRERRAHEAEAAQFYERLQTPAERKRLMDGYRPLDEATLASYAGRYVMASALPGEEAEEVTVAVAVSGLTATMPGVTFDLRAVGTDLFDVYVPQVAQPVTQLAFLRDESGTIQSMSFTLHALMRVDE